MSERNMSEKYLIAHKCNFNPQIQYEIYGKIIRLGFLQSDSGSLNHSFATAFLLIIIKCKKTMPYPRRGKSDYGKYRSQFYLTQTHCYRDRDL